MELLLYVKPNSKIDQISYDEQGNLKVRIKALPVDGKANKYLQEYLAEVFKVSKSKVKILKGTTSQHKKIEIEAPEVEVLTVLQSFKKL
ncbi:MAG TPA: DUF167 domain-containing protein [Cytophagaceae bacterium]|nr:DUF167 domain-containing protein [Cytophagaceae bacterium]